MMQCWRGITWGGEHESQEHEPLLGLDWNEEELANEPAETGDAHEDAGEQVRYHYYLEDRIYLY